MSIIVCHCSSDISRKRPQLLISALATTTSKRPPKRSIPTASTASRASEFCTSAISIRAWPVLGLHRRSETVGRLPWTLTRLSGLPGTGWFMSCTRRQTSEQRPWRDERSVQASTLRTTAVSRLSTQARSRDTTQRRHRSALLLSPPISRTRRLRRFSAPA